MGICGQNVSLEAMGVNARGAETSITSTSANLERLSGWSYSDSVAGQNLFVSSHRDEKGDFTGFAVFNQMEKQPCYFSPGNYCNKNVEYVDCKEIMLITGLMTVIIRMK